MSLKELLETAEFVIDAQGNKKAVLLDFLVWKELLEQLALEEDEDLRAVREIEARVVAGQETLYDHDEVWAEIETLEAQGALPN